jgi:peptidoglycan/LPS O-acetylase OafA/YrhL
MKNKKYFDNLDSIRFYAAFIVYLSHSLAGLINNNNNFLIDFFNRLFCNGNLGVSIFFTLSGFLITYLLLNERDLYGKVFLKKFYIRRTLRIWPLYYLILIFSFVIYPTFKSLSGGVFHTDSNIFFHITFLSNFDLINLYSNVKLVSTLIQNISWSVSIEEQFYLLWPLLFIFFKKSKIIYGIIIILIFSLIFKVKINLNYGLLHYHTLSNIFQLGIGGLFAALINYNLSFRKIIENASSKFTFILILIFIILIGFGEYIFDFKYGNVIINVAISILIGLIILVQCFSTNNKINFSSFKFANKWGKYTYGIYLLHPIALIFLENLFHFLGLNLLDFKTIILSTVIGFPITLLMSYLSFHYFESYFLRLKQKYDV